MEEHNKRYEIDFDSVHPHHSGIVIDVIATTDGKDLITKDKRGLLFCSEDKGEGKEHEVWGFLEFKDVDNLKLAQMGLELIQQAMGREVLEESE